ncbi:MULTISPECIES: flagellar basal body rod protein FlgB [unclassified Endozoicomonas]|uniref:flagellar basal body rod protein FlgB n=1 Tax=unclassified Endozoicomonas TaxID=2644528 RepID=UPI002148F1ED|nr:MULTISPECIES: flagellar basal body rod protein FlgB [unclassified Endozoicomonas]
MAISFESALGVHPQALAFRGIRAEVIAGNLANIDTPGFKARDVEFKSILKGQLSGDASTDDRHLDMPPSAQDSSMMYRIPFQQSTDGNSVELGVEQASFSQNAMDFQTSLIFLRKKLGSLEQAIKGGL